MGPDDNDPVSATQPMHPIPRLPLSSSNQSSTTTFHHHPPPPMLLTTHFTLSKLPPSPPNSVFSYKLTDFQGSPPSESDDFCSACKGAGEFVCCDTCPRVYHFLCCDPPRFEPPSGSFFCHECTEKAAAAEGPVVDRFAVFGPLMKRLDATNPRSFALPLDIQDYFEGVTARNDGSYSEDLKKISL